MSINKSLSNNFNIPSVSMCINESGKLALVSLNISGGVNSVEVFGSIGDKLHRINCNHQSTKKVPLIQGRCTDRISEIFKLDLVKGFEVEHLSLKGQTKTASEVIKGGLDLSKIDLCSFETLDGTQLEGCAVRLQPQINK